MDIPKVVIKFGEQVQNISTLLSDELQQLVASIQQGFITVSDTINEILGVWTDMPFAATNFATNTAGSITPKNQRPYVYRYKVIGKTMFLLFSGRFTINNASTNEIRVKVPTTAALMAFTGPAVDDVFQQRTAGLWNDQASTVGGVAGVFIQVPDRYVSVQRWDGTAAANYPVNDVFIGFQIAIPLL